MRPAKHIESLEEVLNEITVALEDPGGLRKHQRRLAMMLSLGIADLVEIYFHRLGIMKPGSRIKHDWFRKKDLRERLRRQTTGNLDGVEGLEEILERCRGIEESRNDIAYGSPLEDEGILREKIDEFLEIKDIIEEATGDRIE